MEPRLGHDFSQVRVHTDRRAAESARAVNALAYTVGRDVVFGEGQYSPRTHSGQKLLAHELTHTIQQGMQHAPSALQRKQAKKVNQISLKEFIDIVKRVEASNRGLSTAEIIQMVSKTKYPGRDESQRKNWEYLLPSTEGVKPVAEGGSVTGTDVDLLSTKLNVQLPEGGLADPLHIVVSLVAKAEKNAPGAGGAGGLLRRVLVSALPSGVSQLEVVGWLGDVAHAAAEWWAGNPHPRGGDTKQEFMDEYAPESDLMGDVDGIALGATSGEFVFNPADSLSSNLERFYFPAQSQSRTGKNRRFHIFCAVEGFDLEPDGVTLTDKAVQTIKEKVRKQSLWFFTLPGIGDAFSGEGLKEARQIQRAKDWEWFANRFIEFVQKNLKSEGR